MQAQGTPNRAVATRLVAAIRTFARSEVGWRAKLIFGTILVLLIGANGLNVANSFVNRNLMSAIAERHTAAFVWQAELTLAVFAGSTIVAVLTRFAEEREWMRDIVFFPLAAFLMRRATWLSRYQSSAVATMTVFVLFGVWHSGASLGWQYWLMGFLLGAAVIVEFYLGQWARNWPEIERFSPPPMVATVARTLYANLYFAMAASLMSINWQQRGVTPADWIRGIGRFL
jgi:ABC-type uncharacterized transport system fused permease/ATPase subunit